AFLLTFLLGLIASAFASGFAFAFYFGAAATTLTAVGRRTETLVVGRERGEGVLGSVKIGDMKYY
ncbi:hypothetical protein PSY47_23525, partial [Shigella flexneri]|nr:hypothetical protein [Shigella flexneri]